MTRGLQPLIIFFSVTGLALAAWLSTPAPAALTPQAVSTPTPPPITVTVSANPPAFEQIINLGVPAGNSTAPQRLALNAEAGEVYIFAEGVPVLKQGNSISKFDIESRTFTALARINRGSPRPLDLQFDAPSGWLFALWNPAYGSRQPRTLTIVEAQSLQIVQEIPHVDAFAVVDSQLFTAGQNQLTLWARAENRFTPKTQVDLPPANTYGPMAVNLAANRLYLAREQNDSPVLEIFSADTLTLVDTYPSDGPILNIMPNPAAGSVFVVEHHSDTRLLQPLSIDGRPLSSPTPLGPYLTSSALALSPDGATLYFNSGQLRPLDPPSGDDTGPAFIDLNVADLTEHRRIPLLTNFNEVVVDAQTQQAFAVYPFDHLLYVIDLQSSAVQNTYTAVNIRDILVDETAGHLFVTDTAHRVRRLDAQTFEPLAETRLDTPLQGGQTGRWTGELALDKTRNRLYVSGEPAFVLDAGTLNVLTTLQPGGQVAPDPSGNRVYLSNCGVTLLAAGTLTGTEMLPGSGPREDQFSPNPCVGHSQLDSANRLLYSLVPNNTPGSNSGNYLYVYDLAGPTLIFTDTNISIGQVLPDPARRRAFVSQTRHTFQQLRLLSVFADDSAAYTHRLLSVAGQSAYSPASRRLYLSDNHRLLALNADTLAVVSEMPLPSNYDYQVKALNSQTERLYLAGFDGQMLVAQGSRPVSRTQTLATLQAANAVSPTTRSPTGAILQLEHTANGHLLARINTGPDGFGTPRLFLSTDEGQNWQDLTRTLPPFDAQAMAVSPDFADDQTLLTGLNYFGNTGGLYRSTNGGQTWEAAMSGLRDLWVSQLFVSPDENLWLAATTYAGLHASTDRGRSWTPLAELDFDAPLSTVSAAAVSPDRTVLVSQSLEKMNGLFRTTFKPGQQLDGWQPVLGHPLNVLAFAPNGQTALGFGTTIWQSTDAGRTWTPGGTGLSDLEQFQAQRFLFSPNFAQDQTVYFFLTHIRGDESGRLYRSTDSGQMWQPWAGPPDNKLMTAVTSTSSGDFLLGDSQGRITRLSPADIDWLEPQRPESRFPMDDLAVASGKNRVQMLSAVGHARGLFTTTDGGQTWQRASFPVRSTSFAGYRLALAPNVAADPTLYVATGFSLHRSVDGGASWQHLRREGQNLPAENVTLSPHFAEDDTVLISTPSAILRSTDRGESWQNVLARPQDAGAARILAFAPSGDVTYIWFDYHDAVFISSDNGRTWQEVPGPSDDYFAVSAGAVSPDGALMAASEFPTRLMRVSPSGERKIINNTLPEGLSNINAMSYTPAGILLVAGEGGLFESAAEGQRWRSLNRGLPPRPNIQHLQIFGDQIFVGLADGTLLLKQDKSGWYDVSIFVKGN